MLPQIKEFIKNNQEEIVLIIGVILISLLCFAAGYITASLQQKEPLIIEQVE